jgi:uncharacterized membrane protein YidH (DUF202 family)
MPILSPANERRLLQWIVAALALVPILAGAAGVLRGLDAFDPSFAPSLNGDSHVRYLSGLLAAIGLGFWSTVPRIEAHGDRFRLLTGLVLIGGFARLYGIARYGLPGTIMLAALVIELVLTPLLALWREGVDVRANCGDGSERRREQGRAIPAD